MINSKYPKASSFVEWALKRSRETFDPSPVLYERVLYQATYRAWIGNIGSKASSVYREVGKGRLYLVNDDFRQVWIENAAKYVTDYGAIKVGEVVFTVAKCGRCNEVLDDEASAKVNACEDCITAVIEDPERELESWSNGEWGL